jgi:small subunit ribosomal protein S17
MPKRVVIGVVTSDKMAKTRRVEIARLVKHPKYKKYVRRRTVCYVHDEDGQAGVGDTVEIVETRPLSKLKRWQLVRVISKSSAVDVAALRAARNLAAEAAETAEAAEGP